MRSQLVALIACSLCCATIVNANEQDDARFNVCRSKLLAAKDLHVLSDLDWKPPAEPHLVVGPGFFTIGVGAKQGFAETVNCFLMAGARDLSVDFDLLDPHTGQVVGRFAGRRLTMRQSKGK
jgi:hypothetical protein